MAVLGLIALGLLLLWRREWLGVCTLPVAAWLGVQFVKAPESTVSTVGANDGLALMLNRLAPAWSRQLDAINASVQDGSTVLLTSFSTMLELQERLHEAISQQGGDQREALLSLSQQLGAQCEIAMQGLQSGDRLTQMLGVLNQDLQRFHAQMDRMEQAGPPDAERWLSELEARFTTEEQRNYHRGEAMQAGQKNVHYF